MGRRRKARELAVQVLFSMEFTSDGPDEAFDEACELLNSASSKKHFAKELVVGVREKKTDLDELISRASKNWKLDRMLCIDMCILRLAVYEMLFMEDIPAKVSIDEAVEIGKKFGSDSSGRFINGVLDNIYNSLVKRGKLRKTA